MAVEMNKKHTNKTEALKNFIHKDPDQEQRKLLIRSKLIKAEQAGFTNLTAEEILVKSKEELRCSGGL